MQQDRVGWGLERGIMQNFLKDVRVSREILGRLLSQLHGLSPQKLSLDFGQRGDRNYQC